MSTLTMTFGEGASSVRVGGLETSIGWSTGARVKVEGLVLSVESDEQLDIKTIAGIRELIEKYAPEGAPKEMIQDGRSIAWSEIPEYDALVR